MKAWARVSVGVSASQVALGAAWLALAAPAAAQVLDPNRPIIITAPQLFRDVTPERSLDPDAIDSYGLSTIDELLSELQIELGDGEDLPLIIVNGQRLNSVEEIGALPVEALLDLVVLPRGSAVRAGGTAGQRVISLTLKPSVRSVTLTAAEKVATEGDFHAERGEAIGTWVKGPRRINVALRGRQDGLLYESDRGIIQPEPNRPYALTGNIVGYPSFTGEIDPALSALAGEIVTVVPLPAANPTLAGLAALANQPAKTDIGDFRTLRPRTRNFDLNATFSDRLATWLTGTATVRLNRSPSLAYRGLPGAVFILSPDNPASPFANPVGIAVYGADPLRFASRRESANFNITLDATLGTWAGNLNLRHDLSTSRSTSERGASFAPIPLAPSIDPFGFDFTDLIAIRSDRVTTRTSNSLGELTVNGPLFHLPAGDVAAVVEGRLSWDKLKSQSTYTTDPKPVFRRNEQAVRVSLDVPLTSRSENVLAAIGDLRATGEYSRVHYSDAGTLTQYGAGLIWDPVKALQLRASIEESEVPASIQLLGDPVIVTPGVRTFDPLTGQTVDVTQISGGNPGAKPQTTTTRRLSAILRLVPRLNLQLTADYTDTDRRDFISYLPDQSAAIMAAFPDRFVRDSAGTLVSIDIRPVNFESERDKRLRWGVNMNTRLGPVPPPPPPRKPGQKRARRQTQPYLQLSASHTMILSDEIVIRPGLPRVDLLDGGAIGIGGGKVRHQIDASGSLTANGLGIRANLAWRGKSKLLARAGAVTDTLKFSDVALLNLRLFAEGKRLFPDSKWAKGLRLSLDFNNVFNDRQRVRNSAGDTPLQYQPGYRDPIGRTVELEIRAVF